MLITDNEKMNLELNVTELFMYLRVILTKDSTVTHWRVVYFEKPFLTHSLLKVTAVFFLFFFVLFSCTVEALTAGVFGHTWSTTAHIFMVVHWIGKTENRKKM